MEDVFTENIVLIVEIACGVVILLLLTLIVMIVWIRDFFNEKNSKIEELETANKNLTKEVKGLKAQDLTETAILTLTSLLEEKFAERSELQCGNFQAFIDELKASGAPRELVEILRDLLLEIRSVKRKISKNLRAYQEIAAKLSTKVELLGTNVELQETQIKGFLAATIEEIKEAHEEQLTDIRDTLFRNQRGFETESKSELERQLTEIRDTLFGKQRALEADVRKRFIPVESWLQAVKATEQVKKNGSSPIPPSDEETNPS